MYRLNNIEFNEILKWNKWKGDFIFILFSRNEGIEYLKLKSK